MIEHVDPFIGSAVTDLPVPQGLAGTWWWPKPQVGNTHPGATYPFGMASVCAYSGAYPTGYGIYQLNTEGDGFRDGKPVVTLEQPALVPMLGEHPIELGVSLDVEGILARFREDERYREMFEAVFPGEDVTLENIVKAISCFERTLISIDSPYDRYSRGELGALSQAASRGLTLFFSDDLKCHDCHGGLAFSSASEQRFEIDFHNTGLYNIGGTGAYPDGGLYQHTGRAEDMGRFRVPTLRNLTATAPYLHDGSMATLEEVIDVYERGGRLIEAGALAGDGAASPYKSAFVAGFTITDEQRADLIAFLESLTDESFLGNPRFAK